MKFTLLVLFVLGIGLNAQTQQTNLNLDSLYNKYLSLKTGNIKTGHPVTESIVSEDQKCGFWLSNQVRFNFQNFSLQQQKVLAVLLQRPALETSIVSPSGFFRIHFNLSTDIPAYQSNLSATQNANLIAQIADSVYDFEVNFLGYPAPPNDDGGGDNKYDIYLSNLGGSTYASTEFENIPVGTDIYPSYMIIDNDYEEHNYYTNGLDGARATLAHEFHHAIQGGVYALRLEDRFFYEITSTAMEEFVYDDINDYYQYINLNYSDSYFRNPSRTISDFEGYGLAIWNIFLKEKFGYDIIKRQWEFFRNERALTAINSSLSLPEYSFTFKRALNVFGIWAYYTGYRKGQIGDIDDTEILPGYFEEGENYPLIRMTSFNYQSTSFPLTITSHQLSNNYIRVLIDNGSYLDTVVTIISNSNLSGALNNSSDENFEYSIFLLPQEGAKLIANNYYSKLTSQNLDIFTEANILNNKLVNGGEFIIAEADFAYPAPFSYSKNSKLYIPVNYNKFGEAHFYIYSPNMDLVYDAVSKIVFPNDKFVLEWNGRDSDNNKLPTGVYLFVTESEDNIRKGKIVIYNE